MNSDLQNVSFYRTNERGGGGWNARRVALQTVHGESPGPTLAESSLVSFSWAAIGELQIECSFEVQQGRFYTRSEKFRLPRISVCWTRTPQTVPSRP
jgi:hypothetical protein